MLTSTCNVRDIPDNCNSDAANRIVICDVERPPVSAPPPLPETKALNERASVVDTLPSADESLLKSDEHRICDAENPVAISEDERSSSAASRSAESTVSKGSSPAADLPPSADEGFVEDDDRDFEPARDGASGRRSATTRLKRAYVAPLGVKALTHQPLFCDTQIRGHDINVVTSMSYEQHMEVPLTLDLVQQRAQQITAGIADAGVVARLEALMHCAWRPRTQIAYQSAWRIIEELCRELGVEPVPMTAGIVAMVLSELAHFGYATVVLRRFKTVLALAHTLKGYPDPTRDKVVAAVMNGAARVFHRDPVRKSPLMPELLEPIYGIAALDGNGVRSCRDYGLLGFGVAGAFRGDEMVNADVKHVAIDGEKMVVSIPRSKTDRLCVGQQVTIYRGSSVACPVSAVERWIRQLPEPSGPLFRKVSRFGRIGSERLTHRTIPRIVKRYVRALGLDESAYAAHSMRAGFVTSALESGVRDIDVMRHTRHRNIESLLTYYRPDEDIDITKALGL